MRSDDDERPLPEGILTFLLTDIEGSTGLWERHAGTMGEALRRHDRLIADVVNDHRGRLIKSKGEGDSSLSVFARASDALAAAAELDRAVRAVDWDDGIDVRLRIAVHTGECELRDGDYFGPTLNRAARVRSIARGGEILVSDATCQLVADRLPPGSCLLPVGEYELRGLARPENISRLRVPSAVDPSGSVESVGPELVAAIATLAAGCGLPSLESRYSVVFVFPGTGVGRRYPDLSGCTLELAAFVTDAAVFAAQGIQLLGLTGEGVVLADGHAPLPFPVGILSQDAMRSSALDGVERDGRRYASRVSYAVFPAGDGVRITGITGTAAHVRRCYDVAVGQRLAAYLDAARNTPEVLATLPSHARLADSLPNGADSVSISRIDVTTELVCKMAAPAVIDAEATYITRINGLLLDHAEPPVFPMVLATSDHEDPSWYLMEAANPQTLDSLVFADELRTALTPDREGLLVDALRKLRGLYQVGVRPEVSPVARYHYLDRFRVVPDRDDTHSTFASLCGDDRSFNEVLSSPVRVDGGVEYASYREQVSMLEEHLTDFLQPVGCYLHGDAHLPNMLVNSRGDEVVFIDPRTVWDGQTNDDPGFGDPLYDLGTLLHSVHVMSTILRAVEIGATDSLLTISPAGSGALRIQTDALCLLDSPAATTLLEHIGVEFPSELLGRNWEARLHVNAANALLGWLKYQRALVARTAWYAVFVSLLYHLDQARQRLEP